MQFASKAVWAAGAAVAAALAGSAALADSVSPPSTDPALTTDSGAPSPNAPAGWGTKYSEWNLPKNLYVPGDPSALTDENKAAGRRINFIACPVLLDSTPTPLWIARYHGETYFLRGQQNLTADVFPPQLLHQVLVEGVISDEPRIAGGIVLNPLKLSVMRKIDSDCSQILPGAGYAVRFAKRPPGPGSNGQQREALNSSYVVQRAKLDATDYVADPVPHLPKTFNVGFEFDGDMVWDYWVVEAAAKYALDVGATKIEVRGYRGGALLSDGERLTEREGLDRLRADKVRAILADYSLPQDRISVTSTPAPQPADGIGDFDGWRVEIVITPGADRAAAPAAKPLASLR